MTVLPSGLETYDYSTPGWSAIAATNFQLLDDHLVNHPAVTNVFYLTWEVSGGISTGTEIGGYRVVPYNCTLLKVLMTLGQRGRNGNTIIDINKGTPAALVQGVPQYDTGLSSVYTTQANRPTIAGSTPDSNQNAILWAQLPDVVSFLQHDILGMDIDDSVNQNQDLILTLVMRKD